MKARFGDLEITAVRERKPAGRGRRGGSSEVSLDKKSDADADDGAEEGAQR